MRIQLMFPVLFCGAALLVGGCSRPAAPGMQRQTISGLTVGLAVTPPRMWATTRLWSQ